MPSQLTSILSLPANTQGRDFVVGDLRGAFDLLENALATVFFNPQTDRLFSVGNVVGKHADSIKCIDFFNLPYVYAVLGNNEANLIQLYNLIGTETPNYLIRGEHIYKKGLNWWLDISHELKLTLISTLKSLPIVIETETLAGLKVGVIHAEVPLGMDWSNFKAQIIKNDPQTMFSAIQSNVRMTSSERTPVAGIDRIFAGHATIRPEHEEGLPILGNIILTDTGANLHLVHQCGGLSIIEMDSLNSIMVETLKHSRHRRADEPSALEIPDVFKILGESNNSAFE